MDDGFALRTDDHFFGEFSMPVFDLLCFVVSDEASLSGARVKLAYIPHVLCFIIRQLSKLEELLN